MAQLAGLLGQQSNLSLVAKVLSMTKNCSTQMSDQPPIIETNHQRKEKHTWQQEEKQSQLKSQHQK
jgi:hypothetical protein